MFSFESVPTFSFVLYARYNVINNNNNIEIDTGIKKLRKQIRTFLFEYDFFLRGTRIRTIRSQIFYAITKLRSTVSSAFYVAASYIPHLLDYTLRHPGRDATRTIRREI